MNRLIPLLLLALVAAAATAAAAPATKPAEPKPLRIEELLGKMPKEARPERGQWNEFNVPKANLWLKDNATGQRLEIITAIADDVVIDPVPDKENPDKILYWNVRIPLQDFAVRFDRTPGGCHVTLGDLDKFPVVADEKIARAAKGWKKGDHVILVVTVKSLRVETHDEGGVKEADYKLTAESGKVLQIGTARIPEPVRKPGMPGGP